MGNCLQITNCKRLSNHLNLLHNIDHNHNDNDYNRKSIFIEDLNEFNQYSLFNNHPLKQLNNNKHDLLNENSLNKFDFYSILNDDNDISNDKELNYDFNYYNNLLIHNKFINYFIPIKNKKMKYNTTNTNTTNITMVKNHHSYKMLKSTHWPLINTSILGFTILTSNMLNLIEWLQYNDDETYSMINFKQLSIKNKQMKINYLNKTNTNINNNNNNHILLPRDWLRYTMFMHQTKLDTIQFLTIFHRMKYILHSLEIKTGCKILISKYLFMYKGNLVRKFVIDGPNKKQILQCYSSLPQLFSRLLILECDRPSII
ncbi:unnamed protein product [Schistosoma margrebowiei]|uniref:SOCS box domain-containing protein n=1 Tax=Schistosoma margrebowiei TaxID=48269 RepID=A0A183LUJ1_9TREM|nr:unnamed protein product [Schistosoma margrebowiei]VDO76456.1 unnamed protein product [Schistosoma margrebowiei]